VKVMRRFEKGLAKSIDVKRFLRSLSPFDDRAAKFLDDARVAGDLVPLLVDVASTGEGSVKIAEVVEALFASTGEIPFSAVRAELGLLRDDAIVSPLDVAALRIPRVVEEIGVLATPA
jgi:hypothetical protein